MKGVFFLMCFLLIRIFAFGQGNNPLLENLTEYCKGCRIFRIKDSVEIFKYPERVEHLYIGVDNIYDESETLNSFVRKLFYNSTLFINLKKIEFASDIDSIPNSIKNFFRLNSLILHSCNKLSHYESLAEIPNLKQLIMHYLNSNINSIDFSRLSHSLVEFSLYEYIGPPPNKIFELKKLKKLELMNITIPFDSIDTFNVDEVSKMKKLIYLNLFGYYRLKTFPIGLENSKKLRILNVGRTYISEVPQRLFKIKKMTLTCSLLADFGGFDVYGVIRLANEKPCNWKVHYVIF